MRIALTLPLVIAAAALAQPTPEAPKLPGQPTTDPVQKRDEKLAGGTLTGATSLDKETREKGEKMVAKAIEWLRSKQDAKNGAGVFPRRARVSRRSAA
ncbi:MAG: hypothetical protein QM783_00125 [Phycisphaerales bacterium]